MGGAVACAIGSQLQTLSAELRSQAESVLLAWAVAMEQETWDLDLEANAVTVLNARWCLEDLTLEVLPAVVWKLLGVFHAQLTSTSDDDGLLLRKYDWCMTAAKAMSPHQSTSHPALRLIASGRVPCSVAEGTQVLKEPVDNLPALDDAVLDQFGLPLWPLITATLDDKKIVLSNNGVGAALSVQAIPDGMLFDRDNPPASFDLLPDNDVSLPVTGSPSTIQVQFQKYHRSHQVAVPVTGTRPTAGNATENGQVLPEAIRRKRRDAQRRYRKTIDPQGRIVGVSPGLLEVFECIHLANATGDSATVLILGEPGVGKTHLAELIHNSSTRSSKPFKAVNAGGAGGDINIQRGEWIGYGKGHGIKDVDRNGRSGHLMDVAGGTLFVDEFAMLSPEIQVVFLSVLEGRAVEKIGGEGYTPDVRCIFATNADIDVAVAENTLRQDLVDRIDFKCRIPPLRERSGDVLLLARQFAGQHRINEACMVALMRHDWPGNIRELKKTISRAVVRQASDDVKEIGLAQVDLPEPILTAANKLSGEACRRELWTLADSLARGEGFVPRQGLQRRAGEIMGVGEAQAAKMYKAFGLGSSPAT